MIKLMSSKQRKWNHSHTIQVAVFVILYYNVILVIIFIHSASVQNTNVIFIVIKQE